MQADSTRNTRMKHYGTIKMKRSKCIDEIWKSSYEKKQITNT